MKTEIEWFEPQEKLPANNTDIDIFFVIECEMEDEKITREFNCGVFNLGLFHEGIFSSYRPDEVLYWAYCPILE